MTTNEQEMRSALKALAAAAPEEPPAGLEQKLIQAFRSKHRSRRRRMWVSSIVTLATAAALAVLVRIPPQPSWPAAYAVHPVPPALSLQVPPTSIPAPKLLAKRRVPRPRPAAPTASDPEVATKFYPLPDADIFAPVEDATVVRIQLPRSAMRMIGLPVNEDRAAERIRADVVLGQDGIARAVRFIQ